jgi:L-malate glycosyltransferase
LAQRIPQPLTFVSTIGQPKHMRVLHIASGDLWAGAEVQLYQLLRKLRQFPHLTTLVVLLNEGELARRLVEEGIEILVLDENELSTPRIFRRLLTQMRCFRPHVVHTHRVKENILGSICASLTAGACSIRTVHGAEESATVSGTPRQMILQKANHFSARWLQRCTVAVSTPLAESLQKQLGENRVVLIKNGIDPAYIREQSQGEKLPLDQYAAHIAFVGRMVPVKRVDRFLRVARLLVDHHGPDAFRFHLIGDGPLQNEMQELARSLHVDPQCTFHGFVRNPLPWLSQMSALVLTSDHEGTPMVILEALTLGIPVVAPAVGGLVEALNIEGGYLIADQRLEDYAHAVQNAARPAKDATLVRPTLPKDFDIETSAREYVELYRDLAT